MPRHQPWIVVLCLVSAVFAVTACEAPPVDRARPSKKDAPIGVVVPDKPIPGQPGFYRKEVLTRSYPLKAQSFNNHAEPFRVSVFRHDEPVWIVRWESNIEQSDGTRMPDDIHCHAFFTDDPLIQADCELYTGLFTDGFNPRIVLPEGFAIPVAADRCMYFNVAFNNRRPDEREARMRLKIDYVPQSEAKRSYKALHAWTITVVTRPDLYWVDPFKIDTQTRVIEAPFEGRVHAIGTHLHPYGAYVDLTRERTGKSLYTARMLKAEKLEDARVTMYSSTEGFFVRRGEELRITSGYENPTDQLVDAMGGMVILYDPAGEPDPK